MATDSSKRNKTTPRRAVRDLPSKPESDRDMLADDQSQEREIEQAVHELGATTKAEMAKNAARMLELNQFAVNVAAETMFTVAPDGQILSANQIACERLEYTQEELLQMRISDIDPHYPAEKWPEHFDELRKLGRMTIETQHCSKSGRIFDVEVSIAYFEFGGYEYCCSSIRDITEGKQAERILHLQREVLAQIASAVGDQLQALTKLCQLVQELVPNTIASIMLVNESDGCLRFVAGPGLTPSICGAFEPLTPGEQAGSCGSAAYFKRPIIVEDTRTSYHWANLQHIVEEFGMLACWSIPIIDEHHDVIGTFAISHSQPAKPTEFQQELLEMSSSLASIAIRRQRFDEKFQLAQNELAHFSRISTMGEMASGIAHELNQPLAAMVNDSYVLERFSQAETPDFERIRERASCIRKQAMRAAEIVTSMRTLAKKTTLSRVEINPKHVVAKALAVMEAEIRNNGIRLTRDTFSDCSNFNVDAVQIQQVLINLIRNAIDAMQDVDRVRRELVVTTQQNSSNEIEICIADTGPGVSVEDPESVFEAFQTTKPEGMGLGLTICRSIAEAHMGRLVLGNVKPHGAAFSLIIPCANDSNGGLA